MKQILSVIYCKPIGLFFQSLLAKIHIFKLKFTNLSGKFWWFLVLKFLVNTLILCGSFFTFFG